jgi:hypothetical protein
MRSLIRLYPPPTGANESTALHCGQTFGCGIAMVADQPQLEPMIDQPGVAIAARQPVAAGATERQRCSDLRSIRNSCILKLHFLSLTMPYG